MIDEQIGRDHFVIGKIGFDFETRVGAEAAVKAKTELALSEVSGIMIWEIGEDAFGANAPYSLLRAIDEVIVAASVSVSSVDSKLLRVYPNPVHEYMTIEMPDLTVDRILVRDMQGKLWLDQSGAQNTLEVKELPAGFYILSVFSGDTVRSGKFLKQ